ncbi:MAG TPA: hypothetical protein VFF06_21120 [Polyangia bacterium]|nr:hypothetical protein [Polyangia bacterium]
MASWFPVAAALGANLWILAVAVPLLLGRSWGTLAFPGGLVGVTLLVVAAPAILMYGLARRSGAALLGAFPFAVALPQALLSTPEAGHLLPPVPFALAAASLVGYLLATSRWLSEPPAEDAAPATRKLAMPPVPARWRRRLRMYRALAACAVILPGALIAYANLWPPSSAQLAESFAGRATTIEGAQTLITVGIGLLSMLLYRNYLLAPMQAHLQHDRDLVAHVEAARRQARKGRPRFGFYVAVAMALIAMLAVVWKKASLWGGGP